MNLPPYALPVALAVGCLGLLLVALVVVKRNGWRLVSGRQAAGLAVSWGQAATLLWTMWSSGDWSPRPEATAILIGLLTVNFSLLLAGGEDPDPQALAAAEARGRAAATHDVRGRLDEMQALTARAAAKLVRGHESDERETVARAVEKLAGGRPA